MPLSGQQYQQFTDALLNAFPSQFKLAQMLKFRLDKNIHAIALGEDLQEIAFKLILAAETEGWTLDLLVAARDSNPGNPKLFAFSQELGLASTDYSEIELERIIRTSNSFFDVSPWRQRLGEIESQVCRIEIKTNRGMSYGTGFLLGSDLVMTNYHVIECMLLNGDVLASKELTAEPNNISFRFDYKQLSDGTVVSSGTVCGLAARDWLLDKSPYAKESQPPKSDELDYALLRLNRPLGSEPIGENAEPGTQKRSWISLPEKSYDFPVNTPLFIVQHPKGEPLKLAIDTDAIIGLNENKTVVRYRTNTLPGSSGSPCFNSNWELVAVHHTGDPDYSLPEFNAGTPISAIISLLERRGFKSILGR